VFYQSFSQFSLRPFSINATYPYPLTDGLVIQHIEDLQFIDVQVFFPIVRVHVMDQCSFDPVARKSGLITTVSCADGYICIPRDLPGLDEETIVDVTLLDW